MHRYFIAASLSLCLSTLLYSDELMSKRIESIVDEVSELRQRYERLLEENRACSQQIIEQQKQMHKIAKSEGYDYELFEKNRERLIQLEAENTKLQKRAMQSADVQDKLVSLQKEIEVIKRDNARLNGSAEILVEKNQALLQQLNKLKRAETPTSDGKQKDGNDEIKGLKDELKSARQKIRTLRDSSHLIEENLSEKFSLAQDEIKRLEGELATAKSKQDELTHKNNALGLKLQEQDESPVNKTVPSLECECEEKIVVKSDCEDDNPFPQLMMKEKQEVVPHEVEPEMTIEVNKTPAPEAKPVITEKGSAYRVNKEASIYDRPDGKVIERWEEKTSFTSNVFQGRWIKITGHFMDRKWQKASKEMWVKAEDTIKR